MRRSLVRALPFALLLAGCTADAGDAPVPDGGAGEEAAPEASPPDATEGANDVLPTSDGGCLSDSACRERLEVGPCEVAICIGGACGTAPAAELSPCDDDDACTQGTRCQGGTCAGGKPVKCGDGNPCTADSCDPVTGCGHASAADGETCNDQDPCTLVDRCEAGLCVGDLDPECTCIGSGDCGVHEDGNLCNGVLACEAGACALDPATKVTCPEAGTCRVAACSPKSGACGVLLAPNGTACDDGNPCTEEDRCDDGACVGTAGACECATDSDCATWQGTGYDLCQGPLACLDGVCAPDPEAAIVCDPEPPGPCLQPVCDPGTGLCGIVASADGTGCVASDPCAPPGVCQQGKCVAAGAGCDDGDPCTEDTCLGPAGCQYEMRVGECDDGDPCTGPGACDGGVCVPGSAIVCDDKNPCTVDKCVPAAGGCAAVAGPDGAPCEGPDPCKGQGHCEEGLCVDLVAPTCTVDDGSCATASCVPGKGCAVTTRTDGAPCDDGNPCTQTGSCKSGACSALPLACNDGNPCTKDSCDPAKGGCASSAVEDGTSCEPDGPCVSSGTCDGGTCVATGFVDCGATDCSTLGCDPKTGACVVETFEEDGVPCGGDAPCTLAGACQKGTCEGSGPVDCDDDDACTQDACELEDGSCVHAPVVCSQPFGDGCTEAVCDAQKGCKVLESAECKGVDLFWTSSIPCGEPGWSLESTGDVAILALDFPTSGPKWDASCSLVLDLVTGTAAPWTATAYGPSFEIGETGGLPVAVEVTWVEWAPDLEGVVRTVSLVSEGGAEDAVFATAELEMPASWGGWAKRSVTFKAKLDLDATRRIRFSTTGEGGVPGGVWAVDKIVAATTGS